MERLKRELERQARAEGFDLVGTAASGPAETAGQLARWLAAGRHGGMAWMARSSDLRSDPGRLLPGCRSVVVVAMSYHTSHPPSQALLADREPRVWISRYAWGRDYHRIVKAGLVRLGRWLAERCPGATWRACVDSAPLLEREWAARAGLGWIGKNSQLINRELGSELFLGALLTSVELPPDSPVSGHCGRCTACMDACPTAALVAPRELDAGRCIAYLTVEHRGPIPLDLQRPLGATVAGCDICQEVCPWTARAPADLHRGFEPAPHRYRPLLAELERLDEAGFRRWRAGSPLTRIPYPQLALTLEVVCRNLGRRP